jgi:hypothetical protein
LIEEVPPEWGYDPVEKEKRRLWDLIDAVALLSTCGVRGAGVIGAYHMRGVAPLMVRTLPLYEMTPDVSLEGMCSAEDCTTIVISSSVLGRRWTCLTTRSSSRFRGTP